MIQPLDIKAQKFKKGLFGYKSTEVDEFVNTIYREYDSLFTENQELSEKLQKINSVMEESRLKIFELENEIQKMNNEEPGDTAGAKKTAEEIIKNAQEQAAQIIKNAKAESGVIESGAAPKAEPKKEQKLSFKTEPKPEPKPEPAPAKEEAKTESTSSKFFKKAEEPAAKPASEDDDEIFVGEIEDARKPERMMIGDGEEDEGDGDFEFL